MKVKMSVKNPSDYKYSERIASLARIQRIPYRGVKLRALERFHRDEIRILSQRENPLIRSQALTAVQQAIQSIKSEIDHEQHGVPASIQALQRRLFDGDAREEPLAEAFRFNFFRNNLRVLPVARQLNFEDDEVISPSNP